MKAINLYQPWAELIISGRKTIELRKTQFHHRGILGIRATKTVLDSLCQKFNLNCDELTTDAIVGIVELVDVIPLDNQKWQELSDQHLVDSPFPGVWKWGWKLRNPIRLENPIQYTGMPGIFDIRDEIADQIAREVAEQ
jgi:hypothetical protein